MTPPPKKYYYPQVMSYIKKGEIDPVYLFYGEEYLLAENLIREIKHQYLREPEPELNFFIRYAGENGIDAVINLASGGGLFSDKKLILLKNAEELKQTDIERFIKFKEKNYKDIILILQTSLKSIYQSRLKKIEHLISTVNLLPLRPQELNQFIKSEFQKYGKGISQEAVHALIFFVGTQMTDLIMQIKTISEYHTDKENIDTPDIEKISSVYVTQDVFELNRLIGFRKLSDALFVLNNLMDSGVSPQFILSQLIRHFTLLWRILGLYRSGTRSKDVICRELKIFPKYFPEYAEQAKIWNHTSITSVLGLIHQADFELKDSTANPKIVLDILGYKIINSIK